MVASAEEMTGQSGRTYVYTLGDFSSCDFIVKIKVKDTRRDAQFHCHSKILAEQCKYFSDLFSGRSFRGSRNYVELECRESELDLCKSILELFYSVSDPSPEVTLFQSVTSACKILCAAKELGCPKIISACLDFLEAIPWKKHEEKEILDIIARVGQEAAAPVLARLQPVDESDGKRMFILAFEFVTSMSPEMSEIKSSMQKEIEYMITKDEDAALVTADENIKLQVKESVKNIYFGRLLECVEEGVTSIGINKYGMVLTDLSWAFELVKRMQVYRDFVMTWVNMSEKLVESVGTVSETIEIETIEIRLKLIEICAKVLDCVSDGAFILPTAKRLQMVKLWILFVSNTKAALVDDGEESSGKVWKLMERNFNNIVQTLPSSDQAEILADWCGLKAMYPDLSEAFGFCVRRCKESRKNFSRFDDSSDEEEEEEQEEDHSKEDEEDHSKEDEEDVYLTSEDHEEEED